MDMPRQLGAEFFGTFSCTGAPTTYPLRPSVSKRLAAAPGRAI